MTVDAIIFMSLLWLCLSVSNMPYVDGILWLLLALLGPHTRGCNGNHVPLSVERQRGNVCRVTMELTQALLVEGVPDVDEAIGASRCECVVGRVEGDGIDRIDVLRTFLLHTMTLERILLLLYLCVYECNHQSCIFVQYNMYTLGVLMPS